MKFEHPPADSGQARRGVTIPLAAVCIVIITAYLAFAVDWGYMVATETELQNAADAAALSGARALSNGQTAAIDAAQSWAAKNQAAGSAVLVASSDVELGLWDTDAMTFTALAANSSQSPNAVRVTCRRAAAVGSAIPLFFAPMWGTKTADLSATATARAKSSKCGLIIGLNYVTMSGSCFTDSYNSSNGAYSLAAAGMNGHVCSNCTTNNITMSGSTAIHGNAFPGVKGIVNSSSSVGVLGKISNLTKPLSFPAVNPGDAATNNKNQSIPLSDQLKQPLNSKQQFVLSGGDGVDLAPGTYYFATLTLSGGSTIRISGPTIVYVTGKVDISGGSVANASKLPKNFQLFPMGTTCNISGSSDLYAVVYGPTADVVRSGTASYYGSIIGASITASASGGIHADEALDNTYLNGGISRVVLAQ